MNITIPRPLLPGSTVALVGISGCIHNDHPGQDVMEAAQVLEHLGFHVRVDDTCGRQYGFLSGTDEERARALTRAFADDAIDGVWCLKGGYGVARMLNLVDWEVVKAHPKPLIGFSDITAMHAALHTKCGMASFHGPMPCGGRITAASMPSLMHAIAGRPEPVYQNLDGTPLHALRPGQAEGVLVGGNLSLLAALCGTEYALDTTDKLLFIEEVGEFSYRVDEFLWQLQLSGMLDRCAGILLGGFTDCKEEYDHSHCFTVDEILSQMAERVHVPVLAGLQSGHTGDQVTLCLGRRYRMDADACSLTLSE